MAPQKGGGTRGKKRLVINAFVEMCESLLAVAAVSSQFKLLQPG